MKKIIISSIATLTLIAGTLTVMTINNPQDTQSTQNTQDNTSISSPEAVQSVLEPETVIDTSEVVEPVVEAPVVNNVKIDENTKEISIQDKWVNWIKTFPHQKSCFDELVNDYPEMFTGNNYTSTINGLSHFERLCDPKIKFILDRNGNMFIKDFNNRLLPILKNY